MRLKTFINENKYKGMVKWICKNDHEKYLPPNTDFDICNICGTKKAKKIGSVK